MHDILNILNFTHFTREADVPIEYVQRAIHQCPSRCTPNGAIT